MINGSMPPQPCGVGAYASRITDELSKSADVLSIQPMHTRRVGAVPVIETADWGMWSLVEVIRTVMRWQPDWVILQYPTISYRRSIAIHSFVPVIRLLRRRVLVTLHEHAASPRIGKLRNLLVIWHANKVFVSNGMDYRSLPPRIRRKAEVVPIGSNIVRPSEAATEQTRWCPAVLDGKRVVVGFFGHPFPSKRLEVLIGLAESGVTDFGFLFISTFSRDDEYQRNLGARILELERRQPDRIALVEGASDDEVSDLLVGVRYLVLPDRHPLTAKSGSSLAGIVHGAIVVGQAPEGEPSDSFPFVSGENCHLLASMTPEELLDALDFLESDPELRSRILTGAQVLAASVAWEEIARHYLRSLERS